MVLIALQRALGSSAPAAAETLARMSDNESLAPAEREQLAQLAALAGSQAAYAKLDCLLELLRQHPDKMVIFTQFRATQELLDRELRAAGFSVVSFHGGLKRLEKEAAVETFRRQAQLLVCTESGSEGRNLQFAHAVCNFDLPWNPMKIEQRIGRLSRIGQARDVHVYNLVAEHTVEEAILHLLEAKLNLFELVIGEIDMILGNSDDDREFEDIVTDLWSESADHDDRLFGDRFTPQG